MKLYVPLAPASPTGVYHQVDNVPRYQLAGFGLP